VKHLNPRQGITTHPISIPDIPQDECETPKSPPGDYNSTANPGLLPTNPSTPSVKHLNPRQGITTRYELALAHPLINVCETPKSPPGDYNRTVLLHLPSSAGATGVKHLNPRQGITTSSRRREANSGFRTRV